MKRSLLIVLFLIVGCSQQSQEKNTLANKGSLIISGENVLEINAEPVAQVIDTTGAGDLFAAGFLYGMTRQKSLEESGRWASIAAAEIISHFGVRPQVKLSSLV